MVCAWGVCWGDVSAWGGLARGLCLPGGQTPPPKRCILLECIFVVWCEHILSFLSRSEVSISILKFFFNYSYFSKDGDNLKAGANVPKLTKTCIKMKKKWTDREGTRPKFYYVDQPLHRSMPDSFFRLLYYCHNVFCCAIHWADVPAWDSLLTICLAISRPPGKYMFESHIHRSVSPYISGPWTQVGFKSRYWLHCQWLVEFQVLCGKN